MDICFSSEGNNFYCHEVKDLDIDLFCGGDFIGVLAEYFKQPIFLIGFLKALREAGLNLELSDFYNNYYTEHRRAM